MSKSSREKAILAVIAGSALAVPLFTDSPYVMNLLIMIGIGAILGTTNHLILKTGAWFMGHVAFFAIGAMVAVMGVKYAGLNYWLTFLLSGLISGLIALGFGYATSRVKGIPFAILSVALVEVVRLSIQRLCAGRPVICPRPPAVLGLDFSSRAHYFYFLMAILAFALLIMRLIARSRIGLSLSMIAENESLAESAGLNTVRFRVALLAVSCSLAGLTGGFFAPYVTVVGDSTFSLAASITILMYIVVGGINSFWGPALGAVFLTLIPELVPGRASIQFIIHAAIVLAVLFYLPQGLISIPGAIAARLKSGPAAERGGADA